MDDLSKLHTSILDSLVINPADKEKKIPFQCVLAKKKLKWACGKFDKILYFLILSKISTYFRKKLKVRHPIRQDIQDNFAPQNLLFRMPSTCCRNQQRTYSELKTNSQRLEFVPVRCWVWISQNSYMKFFGIWAFITVCFGFLSYLIRFTLGSSYLWNEIAILIETQFTTLSSSALRSLRPLRWVIYTLNREERKVRKEKKAKN